MPETGNEQFWRYSPFGGLISEVPSEEIAADFAQVIGEDIFFAASLHEIQDYPYRKDGVTVLGPGIEFDGRTITAFGRTYDHYPYSYNGENILGPGVSLNGRIVNVSGAFFHLICGQTVVRGHSICTKPYEHRSNQHEDKDGNVRYA